MANISHELRTPITSIRLLVDTLRGTAPMDAAARDELLEKISVETEALAQLAQELLDLAQIESGQTLVRMVPRHRSPAFSRVALTARLGPQAERKHHSCSTWWCRTIWWRWPTKDQVTRALGNLLHNAIKFTPEGGQIWVTAFASERDIEIEVGDTGPRHSAATTWRASSSVFFAATAHAPAAAPAWAWRLPSTSSKPTGAGSGSKAKAALGGAPCSALPCPLLTAGCDGPQDPG